MECGGKRSATPFSGRRGLSVPGALQRALKKRPAANAAGVIFFRWLEKSEGLLDENHHEKGHGFHDTENGEVVTESLAGFRQGIRTGSAGFTLIPG